MTAKESEMAKHKGVIEHYVGCPACNSNGIVGTDYCSVCWGENLIKVKSKVIIVPCDLQAYKKLKKNNPKTLPLSYKEERVGYPDWTPMKDIRNKSALSWDDLDDMC